MHRYTDQIPNEWFYIVKWHKRTHKHQIQHSFSFEIQKKIEQKVHDFSVCMWFKLNFLSDSIHLKVLKSVLIWMWFWEREKGKNRVHLIFVNLVFLYGVSNSTHQIKNTQKKYPQTHTYPQKREREKHALFARISVSPFEIVGWRRDCLFILARLLSFSLSLSSPISIHFQCVRTLFVLWNSTSCHRGLILISFQMMKKGTKKWKNE